MRIPILSAGSIPGLVAASMLVTACLATGPRALARALDPIPREEAERRLHDFDYLPLRQEAREDFVIRSSSCELYRFVLTAQDTEAGVLRQVHVSLYLPRGRPAPVPAILIVPTSQGVGVVEW